MSFAIAAAGTGGHVFPGLAVGEALVSGGASHGDIHYLGGDRLEASVFPRAGFPFHSFDLRGLRRSLTTSNLISNLSLPRVVIAAVFNMTETLRREGAEVMLGLGGYVTLPAAGAARRAGAAVMISEQNAVAGLANRLAGRRALRVFGSFPSTTGLPSAEWVGNPVRRQIADMDRDALRPAALDRYQFSDAHPVVGVFGGSLGAGVLNDAVANLVADWQGPRIQILHICGRDHVAATRAAASAIRQRGESPELWEWRVMGFESDMQYFYAASDLIVGRAGGAVAELGVAGVPSVLIPGGFGSGGHQDANAEAYADRHAAIILRESDLDRMPGVVKELVTDRDRLRAMGAAARSLSRPDAAGVIARAMMESHG